MWRLTVLAAIAGCAQIDATPELDAPPLVVMTDPTRVIGPDFELDFSATGIHLPDHLKVEHGTTELLGTDDPCMGESLVGYGVTPPVLAIAGAQGTAVRSEITTVLAGPAVAKIHVTFAVDYQCPSAETLAGAADFTVFPSGRIVREDLGVQPSTDVLQRVGSCGCQQETDPANFHDLFFTTFWAFDPTNATQVQGDGSPVTEDVYAACTMYPTRAIGVAFSQVPGTSTRFHAQRAASHALDWPTGTNHTSLAPDARSMTSAIQISNHAPASASACGGVLAKLADGPLTIGDTQLPYTDHDGIYRDPTTHAGTFTITPTDFTVPPGFAISVDLGGASHAVFTREPAVAGTVGIAQREAGNRFLIVFPAGLAPGERITIEPRS